jgi:hypothetical protein
VPHFSRPLREVGIPAPVPLISTPLFSEMERCDREGHDVQSCRKARTAVEERHFSAAQGSKIDESLSLRGLRAHVRSKRARRLTPLQSRRDAR